MKLVFCGGAREVGASCYVVRIDGKTMVLDSGIRMKGQDVLPNLRRIQELGGVDAILVSHAHLDHTGSLPVLSRAYPTVPIYMTHATKALTQVLLYDSLKLMDRHEADIPLYAAPHVEAMLNQIVCYSPQNPFPLFPDKQITATFFPAGHVAGAAFIFLQGSEGTLLYTGDFAVTDQLTVPGASLPKLRPDVLVMESTYGEYLHASRSIEETRLVEAVSAVVQREGKVLFPSFALGRAQEVLLILKRAMAKKQLPPFPIYVDGMVRAINQVYQASPNYLRNQLARNVWKGKDLFYSDHVCAVIQRQLREEIIEKPGPLCVIASSGMLKGGPSMMYAEKFAGDAKNLIGLTGYQDEEAPGRELLDLLADEDKERVLHLDGRAVPLHCQLGRFGLSAHADRGEMLGLVQRVGARRVFLVHGETTTVQSLAQILQEEIHGQIYAPQNGDEYDLSIRKPRKQLAADMSIKPLGRLASELVEDTIRELWQYIQQVSGVTRGYTAEELLCIWTGGGAVDPTETARLMKLLSASSYFAPNNRRLFLFHPVDPDALQPTSSVMEANQMIARVKALFPPEAGLYKVGAHENDNVVSLAFHFPKAATEVYGHLIEQIEEETGWRPDVNRHYHLQAAEQLLISLLPPEIMVTKFSFYPDKGVFQAVTDQPVVETDAIATTFAAKTGARLQLATIGDKLPGPQQDIQVTDNPHRMEQNAALAYIDATLNQLRLGKVKKSCRKQGGIPYIELSFVSPQLGQRYRDHLDKLSEDTGWSIVVSSSVNQQAAIAATSQVCHHHGIVLAKNPSVFVDQGLVKATPSVSPDPDLERVIAAEVLAKTGLSLEFV